MELERKILIKFLLQVEHRLRHFKEERCLINFIDIVFYIYLYLNIANPGKIFNILNIHVSYQNLKHWFSLK